MKESNVLHIFSGPNGSGKSTLYKEIKKDYDIGYFINPDELEKLLISNRFINLSDIDIEASKEDYEEFKRTPTSLTMLEKAKSEGRDILITLKDNSILNEQLELKGYETSYISAFIRFLLISKKRSFCFETVMSHPSKLNEIKFAKKNGYFINLYFICTDNPTINVARVANRVDKGGHNVDESKIRTRYIRTLNNLFLATSIVDVAYFFDNSGKTQILVASIENKIITLYVDSLPEWLSKYVIPYYDIENPIYSNSE